MKKKLIIFLVIFKVRKYDFIRFGADEIKKSKQINFEFHEVKFISPNFSKVFTADRLKSNNVKLFSNFSIWKNEIIQKKKLYKNNLIIHNSVDIINLSSFKLNYFLHKNKIKTLRVSNLDHPLYTSGSLIYNLKWFLKNFFSKNKKISALLKSTLFSAISNILRIYPTFVLKCGSKISKYEKKYGVKILKGHSQDFNMSLRPIEKSFKEKEKFGLFLESTTPVYNIGDAHLTGDNINFRGTSQGWLKSINNFLFLIEKYLKIKILIVPHPKIKYDQKNSKFYNGRKILKERLSIVAKNCELIISRDSTGSSYGPIYNKPLIFVYNNELINLKNNFLDNQKHFARELGLKPVNMDKRLTKKKILKLINFNKRSYINYKKKYLTARNDNKLNFNVLEEAFEV